MVKRVWKRTNAWIRAHWRRLLLYGGSGLFVVLMVVQFTYPSGKLLPFQSIDNIYFGGWNQDDTTTRLDGIYAQLKIPVFFGSNQSEYETVTPADIGLAIDNQSRIESTRYSWWLRVVPTSILWGQFYIAIPDPLYRPDPEAVSEYVTGRFGEECRVAPKNAGVAVRDDQISVVPSSVGGNCDVAQATRAVVEVQPQPDRLGAIRIDVEEEQPTIGDDEARRIVDMLTSALKDDVSIKLNDSTVSIPAEEVRSWVVVTEDGDSLRVSLSEEKSKSYLEETFGDDVSKPAGVTKISTFDFEETSRQDGGSGVGLDVRETLVSITSYIQGDIDKPEVKTYIISPTRTYTRAYSPSDTGLSALMKNYAETKSGTYGVSLIELSGQRRRASFDDTKQFTTASTYKLFVAYSVLRRIDDGTFKWSDDVHGGRDLATCFDDMIVKSDNPCAEELVQRIKWRPLTDEAVAVGCSRTTFVEKGGYKTTAGDLAIFLALLESRQLPISRDSHERLLNAMRRNIYRRGIPAGVSGAVADKVGFLSGLLHDAAIVYNPQGTYVLVIMTDGSSWSSIAELSRQIEALRIQ